LLVSSLFIFKLFMYYTVWLNNKSLNIQHSKGEALKSSA